jgi:hypothetical protein
MQRNEYVIALFRSFPDDCGTAGNMTLFKRAEEGSGQVRSVLRPDHEFMPLLS